MYLLTLIYIYVFINPYQTPPLLIHFKCALDISIWDIEDIFTKPNFWGHLRSLYIYMCIYKYNANIKLLKGYIQQI